jgi:hypothetical protein
MSDEDNEVRTLAEKTIIELQDRKDPWEVWEMNQLAEDLLEKQKAKGPIGMKPRKNKRRKTVN